MSVPLYLGYLIKHGFLSGAIFVILYSWAILSFMVFPLLCVAECVVLVRAWLTKTPARVNAFHRHSIGLAVGLGGMVATLAVR